MLVAKNWEPLVDYIIFIKNYIIEKMEVLIRKVSLTL